LKRRFTDVVAFDAWYEWYDDETALVCVQTVVVTDKQRVIA
jgi:hypothetical protein